MNKVLGVISKIHNCTAFTKFSTQRLLLRVVRDTVWKGFFDDCGWKFCMYLRLCNIDCESLQTFWHIGTNVQQFYVKPIIKNSAMRDASRCIAHAHFMCVMSHVWSILCWRQKQRVDQCIMQTIERSPHILILHMYYNYPKALNPFILLGRNKNLQNPMLTELVGGMRKVLYGYTRPF